MKLYLLAVALLLPQLRLNMLLKLLEEDACRGLREQSLSDSDLIVKNKNVAFNIKK